jgi:CRISPR-associated protein (TIGR02584 family)
MPEPQGACIPAVGLNPPHVTKALQKNKMIPDRLSDRIHVVRDRNGVPLRDISTESHNRAAADLTIQTVYRLTKDEESAVHFSIAGGRKTMGFLLGTAASLFARPQDSLSHVLVEPQPLEQHPEFFFPPKTPRILHDRRNPGTPINTADANIVLADIPFVRLRQGLPLPLLQGAWSYSETILRAQAAVMPPELILDPETQSVSCQGQIFSISPKPFAMYALAARICQSSPEGKGFVHWTQITGEDYLNEFRGLPGATYADTKDLEIKFSKIGLTPYLEDDPRASVFQVAKSRLNKRLRQVLGPYSKPYELQARKAPNLIGLDLPPSAIRFERLAAEGDIPQDQGEDSGE